MKAVLLAAGLGTRLRPLTDTIPKCMLPVAGRPLLGHWLDALARAGCRDVLVNTHHHHELVEDFIASFPGVRAVHEPKLLGTAGTLRANWDFLDGEATFFVAHADNYTDLDLAAFHADFRRRRSPEIVVGLTLWRAPNPAACGVVEVDGDGRVLRFVEKPAQPKSNLANGAIYVGTAALRDHLQGENFSADVLSRLGGRMLGYEHRGVLVDIGTPQAYAEWKERPLR